ncbi:ROK family transcriptional regulator [Streptomyces sp. TP-A0356]|uniref:ROK family transcriptional regulator n=1 Tax=Streptomyces sp. TP-A0356 TaxID=1359208 RepID=UPI0006E3D09B|nr:ROK family transcriptional regulator [Streptomyces sp. TP-A0356]
MPASPSTARAINDRLALRLLQQEGPLTAGQLKQLTGLSRPTVADLVERLTAAGFVAVVGESGEQRRGPNARLYGIVADRAHLAALDVRTESVSVLVSDLLGEVLAEASVPIGGDTGTGPAVEQAVTLVERAAKEAGAERLHTVGIGAPGLIDPASGELRDSSGLPEWHRRLAVALQERLPARVIVENETNLAALAEQREGVARDRDTFVLLWLGHGTGAAVVLDGALRRGASGGTGEIGFLPVPGTGALPSARDCEGGFHSLAGASAIAELAARHGLLTTGTGRQPVAAELVGQAAAAVARGEGAGTATTGAARGAGTDVAHGAATHAATGAGTAPGEADRAALPVATPGGHGARGHTGPAPDRNPGPSGADRAARFLDALADRLAIGAASVTAILDPGCVVLGGEIGQAGGDVLAARVAERLARMSPLPTEVRASALGGGAVLRGALLTARDGAQDELFTPPSR